MRAAKSQKRGSSIVSPLDMGTFGSDSGENWFHRPVGDPQHQLSPGHRRRRQPVSCKSARSAPYLVTPLVCIALLLYHPTTPRLLRQYFATLLQFWSYYYYHLHYSYHLFTLELRACNSIELLAPYCRSATTGTSLVPYYMYHHLSLSPYFCCSYQSASA